MNTVTPTEALLQVARTRPFAPAVRTGSTTWSYAALWARVRELSTQLDKLDQSGAPVGLFMGLEIDYVAAAHAVWLSGRTAVFLSPKWTPDVLESILKRTDVQLVLYGTTSPAADLSVPSFGTFDYVSPLPPSFCPPPQRFEVVEKVPLICSVTPTSGSTGVPKSIVLPMRKSLAVLDEESSTILKPKDGQWLRGGTTFLRPLFEIRRFMFNHTTLYLDDAISVADQCASFCAELDNTSNTQPLRVHFTPSVFRAFVDYVKMKYGPGHSFSRLYWMVIGGESLSLTDLHLAKQVFPQATIACNYACSEVGFAGVCQMFVRPEDPVPELINFNATQGCEDLVLLDDDMKVVPKHEGASGIIGIITSSCATHYMGNDEATNHMFRPWGDDRILLYTDDIGNMAADGRITINGRRSRNVKINGLFIDMDHVERALNGGFPDGTVQAYKLVKSIERIVLFWTGDSTNMQVLKSARETLRKKLGDSLAMVVASTRYIEEMPYNASYKIDLAKLQSIADEDQPAADPAVDPPAPVAETTEVGRSRTDEIADEIAAEVAKLGMASTPVALDVPLTLVGLNSVTVVQLYFWLQEHYDYDDDMSRLFEEEVSALVLAHDITGEPRAAEGPGDDIASSSKKVELTTDIINEITRLTKSAQQVSVDVPLILVGINSITVVQLYFWLQSTFDYDGEMSRLFEEDCSVDTLAGEILGEDTEVASDPDSKVQESVGTVGEVEKIASAVATEVARLSKATDSVPTDVPLTLAGLNSITVIQLHFWLQANYDYDEDMSRLFEEEVTCEVVARDIFGVSQGSGASTPTAVESGVEQDVIKDEIPTIAVTFAAPSGPIISVTEAPVSSPVMLTPVPEQKSRLSSRVGHKPKALDLSSSSNFNTELKSPMRTGFKSAGMRTADLRSGAMIYGMLALTLLNRGNSPSLSVIRPSLDMLPEIHSPIAPVSPWMTESFSPMFSPNSMLCV